MNTNLGAGIYDDGLDSFSSRYIRLNLVPVGKHYTTLIAISLTPKSNLAFQQDGRSLRVSQSCSGPDLQRRRRISHLFRALYSWVECGCVRCCTRRSLVSYRNTYNSPL